LTVLLVVRRLVSVTLLTPTSLRPICSEARHFQVSHYLSLAVSGRPVPPRPPGHAVKRHRARTAAVVVLVPGFSVIPYRKKRVFRSLATTKFNTYKK
jgi:hypothetical protein